METDQLETFLAVATLGGFTKASFELHRSQPAVSRRVRALEDSLGVTLFEREGRDISLTAAGQALLPHAQAAVASIRDGERVITKMREGTEYGPSVCVAIVGTLADSHLVKALRVFKKRFPKTGVSLQTATSREVSALVKQGDAEFGVRYFADKNPDLVCSRLGSERLYLVAPKGHRLAKAKTVTGADLLEEHWLSFPMDTSSPDSFGYLLQRELLGLGIDDPNISYVDSLTAQKRLVQAGYGIALMPISSCEEEIRQGTICTIEVRAMKPHQPIVAVRRRAGLQRKSATALLNLIRKHVPT